MKMTITKLMKKGVQKKTEKNLIKFMIRNRFNL